ncbi:hypothetical protein ACI797_08760 [Geodermatophilus sp. SYSU D00691]
MKKIVLAATAMGGAALVAFGASGTFAAFNAEETLSTEVGSGQFTLNTGQSTTANVDPADLNPGQSVDLAYFVANNKDSDFNGVLKASFGNLKSWEHGCLDPESDAGDTTCGNDGHGEFQNFATVRGSMTSAASAAECTALASQSYALGTVSTLANWNAAFPATTLAPGAGTCIVLQISLPDDSTNNLVQGDTASFDVTFRLDQGAAV